jgi:hypothetical protein
MKNIIVILFASISFCSLFANATLQGKVYNQETNELLLLVDILVWAESSTPNFWEVIYDTETDENGSYIIDISPGEYCVDFYVNTPIYGSATFDITLTEGQIVFQDVYIEDTGMASWDTGHVFETDMNTGEQIPLPDVSIYVNHGPEPVVTTNENGFFGIVGLCFETYTWSFVKDGYETLDLEITACYNEYTIEMTHLVGSSDNISFLTQNLKNYPNPFNPSTTISFSLKEESHVLLEVYNVKGQQVKQLINKYYSFGSHSINWDGDNDSGNLVSSGIYYLNLSINNKKNSMTKCLLLK